MTDIAQRPRGPQNGYEGETCMAQLTPFKKVTMPSVKLEELIASKANPQKGSGCSDEPHVAAHSRSHIFRIQEPLAHEYVLLLTERLNPYILSQVSQSYSASRHTFHPPSRALSSK